MSEGTAAPRATLDASRRRGSGWALAGLALAWVALAFVSVFTTLVVVLPAVTGSTPYTIVTGSMEPRYPAGTLLVVTPTDPHAVRIGDVITYRPASGGYRLVTHRVVEIVQPGPDETAPSFVTEADASGASDPQPVAPTQVSGRVWYAVPWVGAINNFVNGDLLRAFVAPMLAGMLFFASGYAIVARLGERRRLRVAALGDR
ncbi:signal peptidase I [Agromyces intestinalis]|nr:signal peptidase I [Agromyces intestinalis]